MNLDDLDFDEILKPLPKWQATGDTFPHREGFGSWAWYWDSENRRWLLDAREDDPCLKWAQKLEGVEVRKVS